MNEKTIAMDKPRKNIAFYAGDNRNTSMTVTNKKNSPVGAADCPFALCGGASL